jgi:FAD:protein FMN transferase
MKHVLVGIALAGSGLLASAAARQEPAPGASEIGLHEVRGDVMGTSFRVEAVGTDAVEQDLAAAVAELRRIDDGMTTWRDSELTRLNARSGQGPVEVSAELCSLVARSLAVAELTDGAFDPTWHSVAHLWDFRADPPVLPDGDELAAALERVGWRKVRVDLDASTIELPEGTTLGLGGIAKGYGVDRAMSILMERGVRHAVVDAGGDMKCLGQRLGEPWEVAIKHPRAKEYVLAVLPVSNRCVVTSGDYERYFDLDGKRYHHIIDPRTGRPAEGCMSATVIGPDAALADALGTAMCVLGPERGLAIIERLPRTEALLVDLAGEVHRSSGLPAVAPPASQPASEPADRD